MDLNKLKYNIIEKKSFLCVGLDTDIKKIPKFLLTEYDPVYEFNKRIIQATLPLTIAYKINTAFYEARGPEGWRSLERTMKLLPENVLKIADAKRGDIKNTSEHYAKTFFEIYGFDAVTINPYMGYDSVEAYLNYFEKWTLLLTKTSNEGAHDFQDFEDASGKKLYQKVIDTALTWKKKGILGFVAGANQPDALEYIRKVAPAHAVLIPGVGTQGGDLDQACQLGKASDGSYALMINCARKILYAGSEEDFEEKAFIAGQDIVSRMQNFL